MAKLHIIFYIIFILHVFFSAFVSTYCISRHDDCPITLGADPCCEGSQCLDGSCLSSETYCAKQNKRCAFWGFPLYYCCFGYQCINDKCEINPVGCSIKGEECYHGADPCCPMFTCRNTTLGKMVCQ